MEKGSDHREYDYGVFDAINVLMVGLDLSGRVVYMNRKARLILGYGDSVATGVDWFSSHFKPDGSEAARKAFLSFASGGGKDMANEESAISTLRGETLDLRWRMMLMRSERDRPAGVLCFARADESFNDFERKRILNDLYFDAIVSSIGDALVIVDTHRRIRYMNAPAETMIGKTMAECEGAAIDSLLMVKDALSGETLESPSKRALASGKVQLSEDDAILIMPDGRESFIIGSVSPVFDSSGGIRGAVLVFRDVSERRREQMILKESQRSLQSVLAAMPLGVHQYRLDESGTLIFSGANPAADSILGIKHEELIGKDILDAFPDLRGTGIPALYRRVAEGAPPEHKEEVAYEDERIVGAFDVNAFNTGERRMAAVFFDILERKKAEIDRDRFFEITDDIVLQGALDGTYCEVNSAATRILGWTREEMISRRWTEFVHPDDLAASLEAMKELAKGGRVVKMENRHRHKDGSYRWLAWASMFIREDKKVISVVHDVTEEKRRFEEQKQKDKLEAIGRLAGGVAHDFNNQLAGIMGCAEILQASLPPESEFQKYVNLIIESARTSADLAGQLLAFARKGNYQIQAVDLNAVVEGARSILSLTINRKISVKAESAGGSAMIEGDLSQIQNAVMNLGLNARDAMPDGGTLTFRVETVELDEFFLRQNACTAEPGEFILLSVSDTGVGMDIATRQHLFEPFFSTKPEGRGTGLGLAAVYGIVKSHCGIVDVDTAVGSGSTFKLYFPCMRKSPPAAIEAGAPGAASGSIESGEKEKTMILVIDDENVICLMAQAMLGLFGYETATARSGKEAMEYLAAHPFPDLVILDMVMPDLSGEEVFEKLRGMNPRARVIISSGYSIDGAAQALLDKGAVGFIQKPYRKDALQAAVKEALEKE